MVRLSVFGWSLVILALIGARPAAADPITFTGNVAQDFASAPKSGIVPGLVDSKGAPAPLDIGQPQWMTNNGWYSGFAIKEIATNYDAKTDTLYLGIEGFVNKNGQATIIGDSYGSGTEGDPTLQSKAGGLNPPNFGGDKSVTLAFAPINPHDQKTPTTPVFVVGIPADKTDQGGSGLDHFNAASFNGSNAGIEYGYGKSLTQNLGAVAFQPDAKHPDLEFTIPNFSKIPGLNGTTNGFWLSAYAGSSQDGAVGEFASLAKISPTGPQIINHPEPSTILGWTLIGGVAAWRLRRRQRTR